MFSRCFSVNHILDPIIIDNIWIMRTFRILGTQTMVKVGVGKLFLYGLSS